MVKRLDRDVIGACFGEFSRAGGRLRVLYIQSRLRAGGPSNQLYYLIENLDDEAFFPVVITLSPEPKKTALPKFRDRGIPVFSLGVSRMEGLVRGGRILKKITNECRPDVIHTQGWRPDILSAAYLGQCVRVATLRNYPFKDYPMKFGRVRGRFMAWTHIKSLRGIECPVGCSRSVADAVKSYGVEMDYIQNGVDTSCYYPVNQEEKVHIRSKLGLPKRKMVIVSVGHLANRKDPITVIRGFMKSKVHQGGVLVMIGEGPLCEECKRIAEGDEKVIFTGRVDNVHEYLKAADYFISASLAEGLPNTVMEAVATGIPVVLSDIGPHAEVLEYAKKAGVTFQPRDVGGVAKALQEITVGERDERVEAALSIAMNRLNAKRMSVEYQKKYLGMVERVGVVND